MKNFIAVGNVITVVAPAAVTSGQGMLVGSMFGVAARDAASGAEVELNLTGVFDLPKAASQAWTVGQRVYWDSTAKVATNVVGTNTLIGVATIPVGGTAGETTGRVRLNGSF
ncbi:DUF2190 family protein [Paracoccus chinensis]|uniref:Predicted phage recombinase, RecA/RadA family n=1 Tax=Paracoccus chinensis TaxID=525640 RepID=A0A1G9JIV2_9RHOB|nr:DUF2190 family protein [Paracoccus chinensis]SDL37013.1 Predicted phage recombinase, RecA/RadA family [Paracoccus chinensis]